ncbi:MAG: type IV pilus twitching motility protein PilT, partial [Chthoniobacterales bacterium]
MNQQENPFDLVELLAATIEARGSDLHLSVDVPPMARIHGSLVPLSEQLLTVDFCRQLVMGAINEEQRARLEEHWELDFALQIAGLGRFRANAHYSRGALEAAFRHIPERIPELEELGHRPAVQQLCELERGLILVTGITGSGKSTTMASMIQQISRQRDGVIITMEDPVEYVFQNARSVVKQREVGSDTKSFISALRHVLRQDPDVILVGEMRDLETIHAAIEAAETGHVVFGTLHTSSSQGTVNRIIEAFPTNQQEQV